MNYLVMKMKMALVITTIAGIPMIVLEHGVIQQILIKNGITAIVTLSFQRTKNSNFLTC